MQQLKIFIELTRLNKPIGFMLLFWPCSWGLALAYNENQNLKMIIIRMQGWQLETFQESYNYKKNSGISLFKKNLLEKK